jgi:hypothetical protein
MTDEFAVLPADLHDLQADVAAHSVFFVHHRRAGPERGEVAQDGLRIGGGAAAAALLARALAEQLRFAEHRDRRRDDVEPGHLRRDRDARSAHRRRRTRASPRRPRREAVARSISSSTSRRPAESAASSTRPEKLRGKSRAAPAVFGAQVDAPLLRRGGGEVVALRSRSSTLKLS